MDDIRFLDEKNFKQVEEILNKVVQIGLKAKTKIRFREKDFDVNNNFELPEVPLQGQDINDLLVEFEQKVIPYCTNFSSSRFMSFPDAGNSVAGLTGAIMADFLQQNLINSSFCAPIATFMEVAVINWLRRVVGYSVGSVNNIWDVGGVITYGGTGSNTIALMLARENHVNDTMHSGVKDPSQYITIVPKGIGHYSIKSASMWLGLGNNVVEVETTGFKYDLIELKKVLNKHKGKIMCVVAYVGDSRTMTIDNLQELYNLVKSIDPNIWLHADACHGFSLGFSQKYRYKIRGIELFDSISTDPHKVLDLPYCISALLVKDPLKFKLITSTSDLIMQEKYAFGQITPFIGSKSWVSLKLWFLIKNLGFNGIGEMIDARIEMAQKLKNKILKDNDFILLNDVDINSVCFIYSPANISLNIEQLNNINKQIHQIMMTEGVFHLHQFSMPDNKGILCKNAIVYPLRYMSGNPNLKEKDLDEMILYVKELGRRICCE